MRLFRVLPSPSRFYAPIPLPSAPAGLQAGISLRAAGDLRLASPAREPVFRSLGVEPGRVYACRQVHSRLVLPVDEPGQPALAPEQVAAREADGLACQGPHCLLTVTVADCLPIFVYDRSGRAFAVVHSGWKATGIVVEAVRLLAERYGADPEALAAVIGPGIGACCYAVDAERARGFERQFGGQAVRRAAGGQAFLDLRAANAALLAQAGVREVHAAEDCTACAGELSSFRREGPGFGRMAAYIGAIQR